MKIVQLDAIKNKRDMYKVTFDDDTELLLTAVHVADYNIYTGREISEEECEELITSVQISTAKSKAVRMIGNRSLSAKEVEKRLTATHCTADIVRETVEWLEQTGLIDDKEYAESIVSHYSKKGYGEARIRNELFKRGIDRELWEEALKNQEDSDDVINSFIERKLKGSDDKRDIQKVVEALCRRGYSFDQARQSVREYLETLENIMDEEQEHE